MHGLMQHGDLAIIDMLKFAATAHPRREIVSRNVDEALWRYDYAGCFARCAKAAHAFTQLGIAPGDRLTSLAWNTHRHFELFFAVPGIGAVLHTANPRLPDDQLAYTINEAGSRILLADLNMVPIIERVRPLLKTVERVILLTPPDRAGQWESYEALIADQPDVYPWPRIEENKAAFLCFTSGTTGDPKGVLYSHRSVVLHALAAGLTGALGFSAFDVVMPCQSLYHATAWGLPFCGAINGTKFVLPCDRMDGASLQDLIETEGVTFTGGVPTIWTTYLDHLQRTGGSVHRLRRVIIGGSAVPRDMAIAFDRLGVEVQQIWGMTETSPLGVVSAPTPDLDELGVDGAKDQIWTRQGRMLFGIEIEIFGEDGQPLPHDGEVSGTLKVRGPWVVERYYKHVEDACDADGWFDTGDIATIDRFGFMRITDRKKDVIKSGGEWISSIDLENIAAGCPGVKVAAVAGVYHPKWEERPIMLIEAHDGADISDDAMRDWLSSRIAKWWMPDRIICAPVPLTATGKIDKKAIRTAYADLLKD